MKRSPIQRRTPLRAKPRHQPTVEREPKPVALLKATRKATYAGTTVAAPKPQTERNPVLLEMARGRRCLLLATTACRTFDGETTVAAHENQNKGMGLKSDDWRSAWACVHCHGWYDQGSAGKAEKRRAFFAAHGRQITEWEKVAADAAEPEKFRKAALWALERVKAKE